jgi:MoxR-like ATPase
MPDPSNVSTPEPDLHALMSQVLKHLNQVVLGKPAQIRETLACLIAGGHLLIEDVPGVGKTTLAHALAQVSGLAFSRVQFTADLLPGDLTGVALYDRAREALVFQPGPVFTEVLLADEINRANAKTQSALLEAMEEQQVTVDGVTRPLPQPFFVIATQNPFDASGTYTLPQSQLDRFLMRVSLGYPDRAAERLLLSLGDARQALQKMPVLLTPALMRSVQAQVAKVQAAEPLLDYVQNILAETRSGRWFEQGLSPRAGLALLRAARAYAWLAKRNYLVPDDVQAVVGPVAAHRLVPLRDAGRSDLDQLRAMLKVISPV